MTPDLWLTLNGGKLGSPFEEVFLKNVLAKLEDLDLAHLKAQTPFTDIDGGQRYCDFTYEMPGKYKIAIEVDGFDKRGTGTGMSHDEFVDWQRRHAALVANGWDVVRFANRDVRDHPNRCLKYLRLMMAQSRHVELSAADQATLNELASSLKGAQSALEIAETEKTRLEDAQGQLKEELSGSQKNVATLNRETNHLKSTVWAFAFVLVAALGIFTLKDVLQNQQASPKTSQPLSASALPTAATLSPDPVVSQSEVLGDSCINPVAWEQALHYIGQTRSVSGPIREITTRNDVNGQPTYINIGSAFPDRERLSLVIWGGERTTFQNIISQGNALTNRTVCATGKIEEFRDVPQIILRQSGQLAL